MLPLRASSCSDSSILQHRPSNNVKRGAGLIHSRLSRDGGLPFRCSRTFAQSGACCFHKHALTDT